MKIYILIFMMITESIYSQNNNNISSYFRNFPNSPSTATFLRYGDIQNSEFTGANAPKIPIHTVVDGEVKIPLTLDYISGNGIKVGDEASSVGLGWNIGLPAIVQSVLGRDDFDTGIEKLKIDLHYQPTTPWGLLNYNDQYLETKDGADEPPGYIESPQIGKYTYYYSVYHTVPVKGRFTTFGNASLYDASPDIFILYLFGEKIEFFISNHKDINNGVTVFTSLKKGYRINFDRSIMTFKITAPDGIVYEFGRNEDVKIQGTISRNFVLTKITDINQNTVNIEYNEYNNVVNFVPLSRNLNYTRGYNQSFNPGCGGLPIFWGNQYSMASKFGIPNVWQEPYLANTVPNTYYSPPSAGFYSVQNYLLVSKISGNFGNIDFLYGNREDSPINKLNSIKIKATNIPKAIKNIDFSYDYWTASNNNFQNPDTGLFSEDRMKKRLFLKQISINGTDNYRFSYFDSQKLPRKDSFAVDHWGYYNGSINNRSYFSSPKDLSNYYNIILPIVDINNNTKISNLDYATSGLLKKITYPTQGYSLFEYELNSADNLFLDGNPLIEKGKGVRLQSHGNYDFNSNLLEKTKFIYENGYSTNPLDLAMDYFNKKYTTSGGFHDLSIVSINSTNNYSASPLSSGDYIGYGKVTKIQVDKSNNENGKIISNYSINPDVIYRFWKDQLPISIPSTKNKGIESGKLLSQIYYNTNNEKIREVINEFETKYSDIYYGTVFTRIGEALYICKGATNGGPGLPGTGQPDPNATRDLSVVSHYPLFSKESLLYNSKTVDYISGKKLTTDTKQFFNSHNFLVAKATSFPDNSNKSESFKYSIEKSNSKLIIANILNIPLETTIMNSDTNGITKTISQIETRFDNQSHLNPTSIQSRDLENILSTEVSYDVYDKGNLLQYTTKNGIPTTIIWGYNRTQPIAKIEGGSYTQIMQAYGLPADTSSYLQLDVVKKSDLDIDETTEEDLIIALNNLRNKAEFNTFKITTYTYDSLIGIKTITPPSGLKESYKYDSSGRLIQILNSDKQVIKEYKYNYGPIRYYNSEVSHIYNRNNCGSNAIGSTYTYTVPEGKYISIISQEDADLQAQNDINANGQNVANTQGYCTPTQDCGFIPTNLISSNVLSKKVLKIVNNVDFNLIFSPKNISNSWSTTTLIGNIPNPTCRPLNTIYSNYSSGDKSWYITTQPDGNVLINLTKGTVDNTQFIPPIDISYSFTK